MPHERPALERACGDRCHLRVPDRNRHTDSEEGPHHGRGENRLPSPLPCPPWLRTHRRSTSLARCLGGRPRGDARSEPGPGHDEVRRRSHRSGDDARLRTGWSQQGCVLPFGQGPSSPSSRPGDGARLDCMQRLGVLPVVGAGVLWRSVLLADLAAVSCSRRRRTAFSPAAGSERFIPHSHDPAPPFHLQIPSVIGAPNLVPTPHGAG